MEVLPSVIDGDAFCACLGSIFQSKLGDGKVEITDRSANDYTSRTSTEIITCSLPDGTEKRLLCKYVDSNAQPSNGFAYEAEVYRRVVQPSGLPAPQFYGSYLAPEGGRWMLLEYIDDALPLNEIWETKTLLLAARWLGRFHAIQEVRLARDDLRFLKEYGAEYYLGLARNALAFASDSLDKFPWLPLLCERFEKTIMPLLARRRTVAHEDYHPHNLLCREGIIYPIDWELTGIDIGEMDLACLTNALPADLAHECESVYQESRWPDGAPMDFEQTTGAGRLCLYFHNLGTRADWTTDSHRLWCSEQLLATAEQMGLLK